MQAKYDTTQEKEQEGQELSQEIAQVLEEFLLPLLLVLDRLLDKRLVRRVVQCCVAILRFRTRRHGLLLSELGSSMDGYQAVAVSAPAGTKRLSNLLRWLKWSILQIDQFLLREADTEVKRLKEQGKRILCIWDGSVREQPESEKLAGLGPVVSRKAKRRYRSKRGLVFNFPPKKAVTVAGMQWTGALITGMEGLVKVAWMSWWTTKGDHATHLRAQEEAMLRTCVRQWGHLLLHIFDRGYGGGPWLQGLQTLGVKFGIRWKGGLNCIDATGVVKKLWQIGPGKK
jgi:hypothetical protein